MPFLIAAGVAVVASPLLAVAGRRLGLVDEPGELKIHGSPVPVTGGVAVVAAALAAVTAVAGVATVAAVERTAAVRAPSVRTVIPVASKPITIVPSRSVRSTRAPAVARRSIVAVAG